MNEQMLVAGYVTYCETLLAIRHSGDWKDWCSTWNEYVVQRWSISKSRAKTLCDFAKFRRMALDEMFHTLPETPENVKPILALPQKQWLDVWQLVIDCADSKPINAQHCESTMLRFHIYANKNLSPEAAKAIKVRRAAKTMAEMNNGTELVNEIGGRALGKNWTKAVEVVIDADQARLDGVGQ
jgi:hypothetical protein